MRCPPNLDHHCNALGRGVLSLVSFQGATYPRRAMLKASCMVGVGSFCWWQPLLLPQCPSGGQWGSQAAPSSGVQQRWDTQGV